MSRDLTRLRRWQRGLLHPRLVAAVIGRLTVNAHIIETGTESYRLRVTRQRPSTGGAKSSEDGGADPG